MNTRLLSILPFAIFVSSLITGCFPKEENFTLLTEQGRTELGVTKLTLQCQPGNNGLSIYKHSGVVLNEEQEVESFFTNQESYIFKRYIRNKATALHRKNIWENANKASAEQLAKKLNEICSKAIEDKNILTECNLVTGSLQDSGSIIVYRQTNERADLSKKPICQHWENTAKLAFEHFRQLSENLRTEQASRFNSSASAKRMAQSASPLNQ